MRSVFSIVCIMCSYLFDARQREAALLKDVSLDDMQVWMDKYVLNKDISPSAASKNAEDLVSTRCLMVHVWGTDHWSKRPSSITEDQGAEPSEVRLVSDIEAFKAASTVINIQVEL